jgi:hypothetical protein
MTIKIEFPSDRKDIALALGKALCEIGGQSYVTVNDEPAEGNIHMYSAPGVFEEKPTGQVIEEGRAALASHNALAADGAALLDDDEETVEPPKSQPATTAADAGESAGAPVESVATDFDVNGMPWDERIHSKNKSTNADGSWRYARMPKNFNGDKDAWQIYIDQTEAELKGSEPDANSVFGGSSEIVPPPVVEQATDVPPPVVEQATDVPPPVVEQATDVPPPVVEQAAYPDATFPQLVQFVAANAANGSAEKVDAILAELGIVKAEGTRTALPQLNQNKELIPEVFAKLKSVMGV